MEEERKPNKRQTRRSRKRKEKVMTSKLRMGKEEKKEKNERHDCP